MKEFGKTVQGLHFLSSMIQRWRWESVSSAASALRWRSGFCLHYLALLLYHYAALEVTSRRVAYMEFGVERDER